MTKRYCPKISEVLPDFEIKHRQDDKYYLKSSYLNPENGLEKRYAITEAELLRGSKYSLNEFKRSEEYNTLQTPGAKSAAIQMFNEKSKNGLLNDEHLLDVINTAKVTDVINTREITFNSIGIY